MQTLPYTLYSAEQSRQLDRLAIQQGGVSGYQLMQRAGRACFDLLARRWPAARRIAILCGGGNNGGDGLVLARLASEQSYQVKAFLLADPDRLKGEALQAYRDFAAAGLTAHCELPSQLEGYDLIVDALLGTGLQREVEGVMAEAIQRVNQADTPVLAVDIPSGLSADTGMVLGCAVRAQTTISFIGLKQGLLTGQGPDYCGDYYCDSLQVPEQIYRQAAATVQRIDYLQQRTLLSPRARCAHKGAHGHVLLIGGDHGMSGAVQMAGEGALRSGAGLVSVATRSRHAPLLSGHRPELMCHGVDDPQGLDVLVQRANVLAVGSGLGQGEWGELMLQQALQHALPMVVDADGLNLLARQPLLCEHWVLTPHPAEAARLLNSTTTEVQRDRFAAVKALQYKYGGVIVLKGAGTLVCGDQQRVYLCSDGNPGMASGGMGDVLTGVIAALRAQGLSGLDAARLGVCLHAAAGDRAARAGERGLLASDLMPHLRRLANP